MRTAEQELKSALKAIKSLQRQIGIKDKLIAELNRSERDLAARLRVSETASLNAMLEISPMREAVNRMSAERSKWVKKLRKLGLSH